MLCADCSPKGNIKEVTQPPVCKRTISDEENSRHKKRKAEEGSIDQEEQETRGKSRMGEGEEDRKKNEEENKGRTKIEGGETRVDIGQTMNVNWMGHEEFHERRQDGRKQMLLMILKGSDGKEWYRQGTFEI